MLVSRKLWIPEDRMAGMLFPLLAALLMLFSSLLWGQEVADTPPAETPEPVEVPPIPVPVERGQVGLQDFETIVMSALRQEFPRLAPMFSAANSCRLPEYGPVISINLQLPTFYFTRPVLQELEKASKQAEAQANRWKEQIERASQIIRYKARESEIVQKINEDYPRKKPSPAQIALQTELEDVRKNIKDLESGVSHTAAAVSPALVPEVDLEKMLSANYQQLIERITVSVRNVLADKAAVLGEMDQGDRICIAAHIHDSFAGNQPRSLIFVLKNEDVDAFRNGLIDQNELRAKVLVKTELKE